MKTLLWLCDIGKNDVAIVGGKGASLGEMFNAGFPVPDAFVVTAQAFKEFLEITKLGNTIKKELQGLDVEDTKKLHDTADKIQKMIMNADFPVSVKKAVDTAYKKLNCFVAVRSSATAEDLPTASFAGQQATLLNIKGIDAVHHAIHECWASLYTARAIYYRVKQNFEHEKVYIAVVVQKMVDSKTAGVMFTVNPVTRNYDEMIIEGAYGLGEAVVSGQVTPDSYVVDKKTHMLKYESVHKQDWYYTKDPKTGVTIKKDIKPDWVDKPVITKKEIAALIEMGKKIEKHYGCPQDIEWAIDGKLYITQSRPVTTL